MHFTKPTLPTKDGTITPIGNGPNFFYTPSTRAEELAPRSSSSPASSVHSLSSGSPPRSLSSSPGIHTSESAPQKHRIVTEGDFTLEEINESDYEDWELGGEDLIRPHQYEDADSEKAQSVKSSGGRSRSELDPRILAGIRDLDCGNEEELEAWLKSTRAQKTWKRRSSGSAQKRTLSQSIGSDMDNEDLLLVNFEGANEGGPRARRLGRKITGRRTSLIFDALKIYEIAELESGSDLDFGDQFSTKGAKKNSVWQTFIMEMPFQKISSVDWKSTFEDEVPELQLRKEGMSRPRGLDSGCLSSPEAGIEKPELSVAESSQKLLGSSHGHSESSSMTKSSVSEDATDWEEDSDVEFCTRALGANGQAESALFTVLDPVKKQIVDRLIEEFWIIFNKNWPTSVRQRPGAPTQHSSTEPASASKLSGRISSSENQSAR